MSSKMYLEQNENVSNVIQYSKLILHLENIFSLNLFSKVLSWGKKLDFELTVVLSDIPTTINVLHNKFTLRGIINFIIPKSKNINAIGHYVSYNLRETNNTWERCDDQLHFIRYVKASTKVNCQLILYTK
jgi:hypothetical protein